MTICNPVCENSHFCFRFFFLILHFIVPHEWIEDCFQENFTLETCFNNDQAKWFGERNKICNKMKASQAQGNSIPHNMKKEDIPQFLADLQKSSEELRAMKLMVLGDGRIGKTTLLNAMKRILGEKHQVCCVFLLFLVFYLHCIKTINSKK